MMYENDMPALEEMRQQLDLLKKKLDNQEIVNKKMLKNAMRKELHDLNRMGRMLTVVGILVAFSTPVYFYALVGASMWFCGATFLMLIFSALKTRQYHRQLWQVDLVSARLVEVGQKVATLRTQYKNWQNFAIPMVCIWFVWCAYEIYQVFGEMGLWVLFCMAVGGLIGGIIGTRINNKVIHSADNLLQQIEEYELR